MISKILLLEVENKQRTRLEINPRIKRESPVLKNHVIIFNENNHFERFAKRNFVSI